MSTSLFHPLIAQWFTAKFGEPTEPQRLGWPLIAAGQHTLIAAPTGSGKTLSAFLVCLDRLFRRWLSGQLENRTYVVYVSPLKALSNDIRRNLDGPLDQISQLCEGVGLGRPAIRTLVRTGDTGAAERAKMVRQPPHILVTTPESLFILLTSAKARETLRRVDTVIVDEIHALARDKRGSHLTLSLERLASLCGRPPVRIGLSATQRPLDQIAEFLVGQGDAFAAIPQPLPPEVADATFGELDEGNGAEGEEPVKKKRRAKRQQPLFAPGPLAPFPLVAEGLALATPSELPGAETAERIVATAANAPPLMDGAARETSSVQMVAAGRCAIVDVGHLRQLNLEVEVPPSPLEAVCSAEQWGEIYEQLVAHIQSHRSTLVFVNTRRLAERVTHSLTEILGEEAVASHHGSLSRELRYDAEQRLKDGTLKAIVATASLEMGIDVGYIDLVCQLGSPRAIATFLQRVGRSGHSLGATPKGRLFPLTRDELMECLALMRAVKQGRLDQIEIQQEPVDILAQQIVATVAADDWEEDSLFELMRRAYPFRELERAEFNRVVKFLSEGLSPKAKRGAYLHRDAIHGRLRARRGARLAAITSGGAIPEKGEYRVVALPDRTFVGTVDEDFAIDSSAGDIFLLGNTSWRIQRVQGSEVIVMDAEGAPPTIPFWFGEAPGRTIELSEEVSALREQLAASDLVNHREPIQWLQKECSASESSAGQAVRYVAAQFAAMGCVPTGKRVVFERFFDESGGMQLVVHAPLGSRINRAWGLAFRKRFCRSFDFELQASADDDGLVLSLGPQHSFPLESLFKMLNRGNGRQMLEQALLAVPMFQVRWRWNVTRALAVLRWEKGKKVQPFLQKFRSEDLLAACFPEQVGCLENHHGDVEIPDHPLVQQTLHDCLHEAMDLDRWLNMLDDAQNGKIEFIGLDTREPSPFSHELINAAPYAFLDGAPLEERRTRAVTLRRGLSAEEFSDLARLDPDAIRQVANEAWPVVRDADEMHDTLLSLGALVENEEPRWSPLVEQLVRAGRAT